MDSPAAMKTTAQLTLALQKAGLRPSAAAERAKVEIEFGVHLWFDADEHLAKLPWTKVSLDELEPGDIMLVKGAEHRYRPLTDQRWLIRFSGGAEAELLPTETGRLSQGWPPAS